MGYDDEPQEAEDNLRFPVSIRHQPEIQDIIRLLRSHLVRMSPRELKSAASTLLALERMPLVTPGIDVTFGFQEPRNDGNYAWADIAVSQDCFSLKIGEHFYDSDVGGNSETWIEFEAIAGDDRCYGSIEQWLDTTRQIADASIISCEDRSDHESLDWDAEEIDEWKAP